MTTKKTERNPIDLVEAELYAAARAELEGDPAEGSDELARRRFADGILALADDVRFDRREAAGTSPRRLWLGATAALAAASAIALSLFLASSSTDPPPRPAGLASPRPASGALAAAAPERGVVLLVAGGQGSATGTAVAGRPLASGDFVVTTENRAAVRLPSGAAISQSPGTRIEVLALSPAGESIRLHGGSILVSVPPGRSGRGFTVETSRGRVDVKGTVFRVGEDRERTVVELVRGRVELVAQNGAHAVLEAGNAAAIGEEARWSLDSASVDADRRDARTLDELAHAAEAPVEISTEPAGLLVTADGLPLGQSPVSALLRSGVHRLAVVRGDVEAVSEVVTCLPGTTVVRRYELGEPRRPSPPPARPARPADAAQEPTVSLPTTEAPMPEKSALQRAQELCAAGQYREAAKVYQDIVDAGDGATSRTARVSLGELLLDNLREPRRALSLFDSYLARAKDGLLAQEALLGRARCLRTLGDHSAEELALVEYLRLFPQAVRSAYARSRLADIKKAKTNEK